MSTKEKILDAALTLFAENGYDGTSVEQIARIVGIKAPSLYKHYKGKEDILNALIDSAEARYEEMFGSEKNIGKVPQSQKEFIKVTMERISFTMHDPIIRKIRMLLVQEQFRNERISEVTTRHQLDGVQRMFAKIIKGMMDEGLVKKDDPRHFTEDCKCSSSMTARIDVTDLVEHSRKTGTKFYINFLYVLSKVLNSRDDYKMGYLWQSEELICYDSINPIQYVFHEDTETCTPVYTTYYEDYEVFYRNALNDVENAKQTREYRLDMMNHPNWFDASYISWLSYDSLNVELPDGFLHFAPIINWGKYREENGRLMMPVSVRLNHAIADGFLVANVYRLLEKEIKGK